MAPITTRKPIAKDRFTVLFPTLKTQPYIDPAARGAGSHTIRTIAWNASGTFIATGAVDRMIRVWNPDRPQVKNSTELKGHTGGIERVAWNPIKDFELASVSTDGTCRFWDVRQKICTATVSIGGEGLTLTWSGDGTVLLAGRKDDTLIPISTSPSLSGPEPVPQAPQPQSIQTNQCIFNHTFASPPSHLLLTRGDGSVTIASYPSLQPLHTLHAHTSSCLSLALSPNGRYLAIGGSDALISLYDTYDWVCKRTIASTVGAVKTLGFSFCGSYVVGGTDEGGCLEIVHVESGDVVGRVELGLTGGGLVAWHPLRYWVAWAGEGSGLKILGAAGGQM